MFEANKITQRDTLITDLSKMFLGLKICGGGLKPPYLLIATALFNAELNITSLHILRSFSFTQYSLVEGLGSDSTLIFAFTKHNSEKYKKNEG